MNNFWCDVVNGICGLLLVLLSFIDNITRKSYADKAVYLKFIINTLKKISIKILMILVVAILSIYTTNQKYKNVEADKEIADNKFRIELDRRDRINQKNFQISLQKSSGASASANAETMAKYYLLYDSVQHKIEKIVKDSAKRNNYTYRDAKPDFDISDIKFVKSRNDTLEFKITLSCKKTAIEDLNLSLQIYLLKAGNYYYVPQIRKFMPPNLYMSSNTGQIIDNVNINSLKNIFEAYFHIYGFYKFNDDKIPVDFILYYNFKDSIFGIPGTKEFLRAMFKQQL